MASWLALVAVALVVGSALEPTLGAVTAATAASGPRVAAAAGSGPASVETTGSGVTARRSWPAGDLSPPVAAAARLREGWAWPAPAPHEVVRRFDPPEVTWGSGHRGVDLAVTVGAVIRSPTEGAVSFVGVVAGQEVVVVAHPDGLRSTFQPVLASVPVGTRVATGDVIGVLTSTPGHCAPISCLHWGVLRGSVYLDPLGFLRPPVVLLPLH